MEKRALKKIPVGESSTSSLIDSRKRYRVRIEDAWYEGPFTKQWFGWNFENYGTSGIQLNLIDEVFEIVSSGPKARKNGNPGAPPATRRGPKTNRPKA